MKKTGEKMFKFLQKNYLYAAIAFLSMSATSLKAYDCSEANFGCPENACNRVYVSGFGGGLFSSSTRLSQMGTAFFPEAVGGPLAVNARGNTKKNETGFGGANLGFEWSQCPLSFCNSDWSFTPAFELEAFFYGHQQKGTLINPTVRLPEHDFRDSFHMSAGVYLANAVLSFNNTCFFGLTPYAGGGIGATRISIRNAKSFQVSPPEVGINHFNSKRSDSTWAFAAQAKVGLRYNICDSFHIFAEYRYLFVDCTNYILGSTDYPTHVPTSPWNVKMKSIGYNAAVLGIRFDL